MSQASPGSKYGRQLIVALANGDDGAGIVAQAEALDAKQRDVALPSEVVVLQVTDGHAADEDVAELRRALAGERDVPSPIDAASRLYLVGEGDAGDRTLGGCSGESLAMLLAGAGLPSPALVSIVGDGAGRDPDRADDAQLDPQATSFASRLHQSLRDRGVATTVNARVGAVRVLTRATAVGGVAVEAGRKLGSASPGAEATQHHAAASKIRLRWEDGRQVREWSY